MKKRFMLSLTALIASAALFVIASFAWFVLSTYSPVDTIPGGTKGVLYDLGGEFIIGSVIYPELELLSEDISITSYSTESLYLRIKIVYLRINVNYIDSEYVVSSPTIDIYSDNFNDEHLSVILNSNFFYESDEYWYYDELIYGDSVTHTLITSLYYDGFKASNEYATEPLSISIILEVSTGEDGVWDPLTTLTTTT